MSKRFKIILKKFLIWKYQHISDKQFIRIASAIIGLLAGLGAVLLKNFTHFIQHLLELEFIKDVHIAFFFIFPLVGLFLVRMIKRYVIKKKVGHGIPSTLFAISKLKFLNTGFSSAYQ